MENSAEPEGIIHFFISWCLSRGVQQTGRDGQADGSRNQTKYNEPSRLQLFWSRLNLVAGYPSAGHPSQWSCYQHSWFVFAIYRFSTLSMFCPPTDHWAKRTKHLRRTSLKAPLPAQAAAPGMPVLYKCLWAILQHEDSTSPPPPRGTVSQYQSKATSLQSHTYHQPEHPCIPTPTQPASTSRREGQSCAVLESHEKTL